MFCFCIAKKSKDDPSLKTFNYGLKKSKDKTQNPVLSNDANEPQNFFFEKVKSKTKTKVQKPANSLRMYIKRNWKLVALFLVSYIITFGAVVSGPIVKFLKVISKNETEKERFEK